MQVTSNGNNNIATNKSQQKGQPQTNDNYMKTMTTVNNLVRIKKICKIIEIVLRTFKNL